MNEEEILYIKAIRKFGEPLQLQILEEECAELIQAISKLRRGQIREGKLIEELVDVDLCISQFRTLMGKSQLWQIKRREKFERLRVLVGDFKL